MYVDHIPISIQVFGDSPRDHFIDVLMRYLKLTLLFNCDFVYWTLSIVEIVFLVLQQKCLELAGITL